MTNQDYVKKIVDLWGDALLTPKFDNGDTSLLGGLVAVNGLSDIKNALENEGDLKSKIEIFKCTLTKIINERLARDLSGLPPNIKLSTDYEPCYLLKIAANKAGINHSLFSIKSSVSIRNGLVTSSFGYDSTVNHYYPMPDGRWLATSLNGSDEDILNLIYHAMNGNEMNLLIE